MIIAHNTVATVNYQLTSRDGDPLDDSEQSGPMVYLHGYRHVLPALEEALESAGPGDELVVELAAEDAYGPRQENLVFEAKRDALPEGLELTPGKRLSTGSYGRRFSLRVVRLTDDGAVLDGNHPLAGQWLAFRLSVRAVREATADEIRAQRAYGDTASRPQAAAWM
ncbi:peptidylprolyl isomerase [Aquisalimonas sp.]|uniref:FKBP-type peptidyl-prolyl cis-trans isomerase n=1 Tax=Aquisalimonas sp. TaxID=1872621 RepID=UPI0025BBC1B3|nr:peptidylprolyl isomerase [Aquisalimonas sp.]